MRSLVLEEVCELHYAVADILFQMYLYLFFAQLLSVYSIFFSNVFFLVIGIFMCKFSHEHFFSCNDNLNLEESISNVTIMFTIFIKVIL